MAGGSGVQLLFEWGDIISWKALTLVGIPVAGRNRNI